jgi:hypothetical protein
MMRAGWAARERMNREAEEVARHYGGGTLESRIRNAEQCKNCPATCRDSTRASHALGLCDCGCGKFEAKET